MLKVAVNTHKPKHHLLVSGIHCMWISGFLSTTITKYILISQFGPEYPGPQTHV